METGWTCGKTQGQLKQEGGDLAGPGSPALEGTSRLGGHPVVVVPALCGSRLYPSCFQEPLSVNQQKRIMEGARSVNALSKALATLKVAAEFLAVTGGDKERSLPEYVRKDLRMEADAKQFQDVPVGDG